MIQPVMPNSGLYVTPPHSAYHLGTPFYLPTPTGPIWAIAFDARTSQYITSSITVTLTLMFSWIWGLLAAAAVYWAPHGFPRRRLVALILLRNTTDPRSALLAFLGYTTESMGWFRPKKTKKPEKAATWRDTFFGTAFLLLALVIVLANVVMGIIIPPFLVVGSAASVNEAELFSPNADPDSASPVRPEVFRAFLSSGSLRSLSSVEIFGEQIRKAVTINDDLSVITVNEEQPMYGLTYEYKVTGVDFGLKRASELTLSVTGSCKTEYSWLFESNVTGDYYHLFGNPAWYQGVSLSNASVSQPVRTGFFDVSTRANDNGTGVREQASEGRVQYAILPGLAYKLSSTESQDPWYKTEQFPNNLASGFQHRIKAQRPVLLCEHRDTWSVPGREPINGILNLEGKITGAAFSPVLWNVMRRALWAPVVARVGKDAGTAALASVMLSQGSESGKLNAGASSIRRDMERLIQAGYVNTLNALAQSSAHQLTPTPGKDSNSFYQDGELLPGSSDFVVRTPDVLTFNLIGLITTGALILLLLSLKLALHLKLSFYVEADPILGPHDRDPNQEIPSSPVELNKDRWARFSAFSAVHLLRNAYEDGTGHPEDDWQCCEDLPDPSEEKKLQLVRCKGGNYGCAGHLATDLPGSRRRSTMTSLSAMNLSSGVKTPSVVTPLKSEPRYSGFSHTPGTETYFPRASPPLTVPSPVSESAPPSEAGRYQVQEYGGQQLQPRWQGQSGRDSGGYPGQGYRGQQYQDEEPAITMSPLLSDQGQGGYPPRY